MVRILVVDDEADVCDFTKSFFEGRGFEVFTAQDGHDAIARLTKVKPDLILLDVRMKSMDGIATLKHIKEISPNTIVIMVTAVDEADKIEEAKKLGARDYVTKPLV